MTNATPSRGAPLIGAIEAGGTKVVLSVGRSPDEVRERRIQIATTTPDETLGHIKVWLRERHDESALDAVGIAAFGPVDFGTFSVASSTPKVHWRGVHWRDALPDSLSDIALGFDTDTNAAGLAEWRWGAVQGASPAVYVTVGTGIGGGLVVEGRVVHGLLHPEMGHVFVPVRPDDTFAGSCPSHGACLEGLASGVAIAARWGEPPQLLGPEHPAWDLEADYLAYACANIAAITSAQRIVLGGGIMQVEGIIEKIRDRFRRLNAGYIDRPEVTSRVESYIVPPGLGTDSGVVGAFALGLAATA